jgi:hypothetical protein
MFKPSEQFFPGIDRLATDQFPSDREVFFGVCPREGMKNQQEKIPYIYTLWAGLDVGSGGYSGVTDHFSCVEQAVDAVNAFPLRPSIIVRSGRGYHLYWLLDTIREIPNPEAVESLLRRLNRHFLCDAQVSVDAFMRLPGTWNPRVHGVPTPAYIEYLEPGLRYGPKDFQTLDVPAMSSPSPLREVLDRGIRSNDPSQRKGATGVERIEVSQTIAAVNLAPSNSHSSSPRVGATAAPSLCAPLCAPAAIDAYDQTPAMLEEISERVAAGIAQLMTDKYLPLFADRIAEAVVQKTITKLAERICLPGAGI